MAASYFNAAVHQKHHARAYCPPRAGSCCSPCSQGAAWCVTPSTVLKMKLNSTNEVPCPSIAKVQEALTVRLWACRCMQEDSGLTRKQQETCCAAACTLSLLYDPLTRLKRAHLQQLTRPWYQAWYDGLSNKLRRLCGSSIQYA